jgi:hypothetical protein
MKMRKMKKIRNASQLQLEKNRLRLKEFEIEQAIHNDWKQLEEQFQPSNIFKNNSTDHPKHHWFLKFIVETIHVVTGKILQKTEEKLETSSEKSINSDSHHFSNFFKK